MWGKLKKRVEMRAKNTDLCPVSWSKVFWQTHKIGALASSKIESTKVTIVIHWTHFSSLVATPKATDPRDLCTSAACGQNLQRPRVKKANGGTSISHVKWETLCNLKRAVLARHFWHRSFWPKELFILKAHHITWRHVTCDFLFVRCSLAFF